MHEAETRALRQAAVVLVLISVLRWGWVERRSASGDEQPSVLPELLRASREAASEEVRRASPLTEGERIDPNRADAVELDRLPGVGPSTARAIAEARAEGTVFRSPDDLLSVRGIGPSTLARIRPFLSLIDPPSRPNGRRADGRRPDGWSTPAPTVAEGPVDLNRADLERLTALPGIGPAIAERILVARREQPFTAVEDLVRVRGIGSATVERLRPHATVDR